MSINTCLNCPDRYPGCHSKCKKYQEAKAEHERVKALIEADKYARSYEYFTSRRRRRIGAGYNKRRWYI